MKIIVGLGNPGSQYKLTRHNAGFIIVSLFADHFNLKFKEGKGDWFEAKGVIEGEEVYALMPMSYMNNSGVVVKEFLEKCGADVSDLLVVVDDFQIPLGTIRIRKSGSDGGHNGLANIIYKLGTDEFPRMRIGIGLKDVIRKDEYIDFVLSNFEQEEFSAIQKLTPVYIDCIKSFITHGITKTMNSYNKSFLTEEEKNPDKEPDRNRDI